MIAKLRGNLLFRLFNNLDDFVKTLSFQAKSFL